MTVVRHDAPIPAWDDLTLDQQFRYAGNIDPWAGPVDPKARARQNDRPKVQHRNDDACGCWASDCAECGPRRADGQRPAQGQVRRFGLDR